VRGEYGVDPEEKSLFAAALCRENSTFDYISLP